MARTHHADQKQRATCTRRLQEFPHALRPFQETNPLLLAPSFLVCPMTHSTPGEPGKHGAGGCCECARITGASEKVSA